MEVPMPAWMPRYQQPIPVFMHWAVRTSIPFSLVQGMDFCANRQAWMERT
jgi:hypothetical protein